MSRKLPDWLKGYLEYTENTEPPLAYHTWTAISCLAGALERKVFMRWDDLIYPNQYIILIGPAGRGRKGAALSKGRELLSKTKVEIAAQAITREKLIQRMANALKSYVDPATGNLRYHCSMTHICGELHSFLGHRDINLLGDITDWYDSHPKWSRDTKTAGHDVVNGMCYNLLGASAPDWLNSMFPSEAIGGGFTSRCIFVYEEHKGKTVADPRMGDKKEGLKKDLIADLKDIHSMRGEITFTPEAYEEYIEWYTQEERLIRQGRPTIPDPRFASYLSRRGTHIKKICMAISASRSPDLVITHHDFNRALALLEATEKKMPRAFSGLGENRFVHATEKVLNFIMMRKKVARSEILQLFYRDIDAWTLEQVEKVLVEMGVLYAERLPGKNEVMYIYKGKKDG